jgi:pimeloyl-ACP methyl ester carboxylesterase
MQRKLVSHEDLQLEYLDFGTGDETVICFHGHGKCAEDFLFLGNSGKRIISINLFLHGNSSFDDKRLTKELITGKDVEKLLEKLIEIEKIEQFHLVAYSQGGRFVLTILPFIFQRVISLHLLAVDGLNDRNFYSWSQRRWWARMLFKRWTQKPHELVAISSFLAKFKVIHPKIVDFLKYYAEDKEKLTLAFKTWSAFRKLRPDIELLKVALLDKSKRFKLIMGRHDQIITVASGKKFLSGLNREDALIVVDCGHDFYREEALEKVKKEIIF